MVSLVLYFVLNTIGQPHFHGDGIIIDVCYFRLDSRFILVVGRTY